MAVLYVKRVDVPSSLFASLRFELSTRGIDLTAPQQINESLAYMLLLRVEDVTSDAWAEIHAPGPPNQIGSIVLTESRSIEVYRTAFSYGASIVHVDADPAIIADVVIARGRGELLASADLVAACFEQEIHSSLTASEVGVLRHMANGVSTPTIAESTFYSDRHVRRIISSILSKAATNNRQQAVPRFQHYLDDAR